MKFAQQLDQDLVPEWRAKYLDYKKGKKKLKAVGRAFASVQRTPQPAARSSPFNQSPAFNAPVYSYINRPDTRINGGALPIPGSESQPLQDSDLLAKNARGMTRYGSIIGSPPTNDPLYRDDELGNANGSPISRTDTHATSLRLPGPAMGSPNPNRLSLDQQASQDLSPLRTGASAEANGSARGQYDDRSPRQSQTPLAPRHFSLSLFRPKRVNSMPGNAGSTTDSSMRPTPKRVLTFRSGTNNPAGEDIALGAYRELDVRQAEFFVFLDGELDKIGDFYKSKEDEATARLDVLREQLHIMRDRRLEEVVAEQNRHNNHGSTGSEALLKQNLDSDGPSTGLDWVRPIGHALKKAIPGRIGKTSQAMKDLGTPRGLGALDPVNRDYSRRLAQHEISYRAAKRKLKAAISEFYRGMELLKNYSIMNREAFRKICKKYDKTVSARPTGRYMAEKVNPSYFVKSEIVDGHLHTVEDLYARYFERGSHKTAVTKLRSAMVHDGHYAASSFRNGLLLAAGAVFGVQGLVFGAELLHNSDPTVRTQTSYLLQLYAGYFLMLMLSLFFCVGCRIWHRSKINYPFIFEFETHHQLDWRQLAEIPSALALALGLTAWLNFCRFAGPAMYVYWPVILIGVSAIVLFNPLPVFYHRSRRWFAYSAWRLFFAGLYPVEFRDFFLGDLFCSETYGLGNIELFFCLYARSWKDPPSCNSSHSRLLGFFSALPGIWRALQCLRRYYDTRNAFPHLANCGKYLCTILYYMSLSLFRLDHSAGLKGFFIFCATVNAVYCSVWDIVMDWSLLDPTAKHKFLRATLAYKSTWLYYVAIILDPILRFNWIFYAIYVEDLQHSSLAAFFVGFSEVCRRGVWLVLRVENEHCTNVARYRAYRDVPLPYELSVSPETHADEHAAAEVVPPTPMSTVGRVGTIMHRAHAQDFERRKPDAGAATGVADDDDDDDDDEEEDV